MSLLQKIYALWSNLQNHYHLTFSIKKIILYSCGAIKQYMHQVHSELMKQNHLKRISGPYQHFTESAERWLSEISFSASWGGMCHCSFNLWLPCNTSLKEAENKGG